ncbi:zinc finger, CCHC-type [Artemisia annua]|uniref:Zinc finger, CCHC-type n=1 Tax=Artemisia annua TaxID=35608 RepID=A0A2U1LCY9_ARTAN|nr:zinc finger, CCHC-type [Artemisia annua]
MEAGEKAALMKKAYSTLILCLGDRVLREVTKETSAAGIWAKLTSLYMTKSLANRLYLKKKLYTESLTMEDVLAALNSRELKKRTEGTKEETGDGLYVRGGSDHSRKAHSGGSSRFKSRVGTGKLKCFICHSENHLKRDCPRKKSSRFVKKGKHDQDSDSSDDEGYAYFGEALVVVGNDEMTELVMDSGSDHSRKAHSGGSSRFKSRVGTGKLKCFICHSENHLKRDCPRKKSSRFVKKGKHDQDSDSSDDEGYAYFGEALVVVGNDEMTELVMDSGGSYHMTPRRDFLYDFKDVDGGSVKLGDNRTCTIKGTGKVKMQLHDGSSFILEDVRYVPGLRKSLISLGTLKKEGYTVKMQMGRVKVIKGCRVMMTQKGSR